FDRNASIHEFYKSFRDSETESRPAVVTCCRRVRLLEGSEYELLRVGIDTYARVLHQEADVGMAVATRYDLDIDEDFSTFGKLERVADQVQEDLTQAVG